MKFLSTSNKIPLDFSVKETDLTCGKKILTYFFCCYFCFFLFFFFMFILLENIAQSTTHLLHYVLVLKSLKICITSIPIQYLHNQSTWKIKNVRQIIIAMSYTMGNRGGKPEYGLYSFFEQLYAYVRNNLVEAGTGTLRGV